MKDIHAMELMISKFLRAGIIFAGGLMLLGWIWNYQIHTDVFFNFQSYDHIPLPYLWQHALQQGAWGAIISYIGLAALIALPVIRVLLTGILFLRQQEKQLAALAFIVLLTLIISMLAGLEH